MWFRVNVAGDGRLLVGLSVNLLLYLRLGLTPCECGSGGLCVVRVKCALGDLHLGMCTWGRGNGKGKVGLHEKIGMLLVCPLTYQACLLLGRPPHFILV